MAWTAKRQPFGPNRQALLTGLASDGSGASVPVAVDPLTGRVQTTSVVSYTPTSLTVVFNGQETVAAPGTAEQLPSNAIASITIKALQTNTGSIYIGGSTVDAATGFELLPGDIISFDMSNTNAVYVDAEVAGEGISWLAVD